MELTNISNAPDDTLKARVKRPSDLNGSIPTPAGRQGEVRRSVMTRLSCVHRGYWMYFLVTTGNLDKVRLILSVS